MVEEPNTDYVDQLSAGDLAFRDEILNVIKSELLQESQTYETLMEEGDYSRAADAVHKLKHKVGILGMTKSYHLTEDFEEELRAGKLVLQHSFNKILRKILKFSKNI